MKKVTKWETSDGMLHNSQRDAEKHELWTIAEKKLSKFLPHSMMSQFVLHEAEKTLKILQEFLQKGDGI